MRSSPFGKLTAFLALASAFNAGTITQAPTWIESRGKGRRKRPRGTGHKHMAYKRANTK